MNSRRAAPTKVYEDFVPTSKLDQEEHFDTIHLNLQGFKKEQLRVALTRTGILNISGERPIGPNKWQRFQKEFPVAENCDRSKISAKIENGVLHVKQPKLITSSVKKDKESSSTLAENAPAAKRQKTTLRDEFSKQDNADIDTPAKEEPKKIDTPAKEEPKKIDTPAKEEPKKIDTPAKEEPKKIDTPAKEEPKKIDTPAKEEPKKTSPETSEKTEAKSLAEKKLPSDESSSSCSSSSESESESTDDETDDETTGYASYLAAKLKNPRNVMKMTLAGLLVLGISLYVANDLSR